MNAVRSVVGLLCLATGMAQAAPLYQCPLTVSGYAEGKAALADFPVLVRISTAIDQFNYGDCDAGGADISFAGEDGETIYPHEVDTWNQDGESLVWVKLPSMAHGTKFLFRWGDAVPPTNDATTVWTDYVGVWHFNENGGLSAADSSPNAFHGSVLAKGANAADYTAATVEGQTIGAGRQCTARSLSFTMPDYSSLEVGGKFTASGIFKMDARTGYESFFNKKQDWDTGNGFQCNMQNSDETFFICGSGNKTYANQKLPNVKSNWTYLTLAYDGTSVVAYNKGSKVASFAINDTGDVARNMTVAGFKGIVDEVRVRKGAVSDGWVKAEYEVATRADYITAGTTEILSSEGIVVSSDSLCYGEVSPGYGRIAEPVAGTTYDFSCTVATQLLNEAETTRAVCTGWELRMLSDGGLIKASSSEGESPFACSHQYVQGESVELRWLWTVQHLVTAETATAGGTVAPSAQWIDTGSVATIVPTPDSGCEFYRWTGDLGEVSPSANPVTVTVDGPKRVRAEFARTAYPGFDTVVFVAPEGDDSHDGSSRSAAVKTPACGIALAKAAAGAGSRPVVVLATGNYTIGTTLTIDDAITVTSASGRPEDVRLNASAAVIIVTVAHDDAVLQGVTLDCKQLGCGNDGAGAKVTAGTVRNCIIRNHKHSTYTTCCAAVATGANSRFVGCLLTNNVCGATNGSYGNHCAALQLDGGARAEGCVIAFNETTAGSGMVGGAYLKNGTLVNCHVYGNKSVGTGGVRVTKGGVYNTVIFANETSAAMTAAGKTYHNITPGSDEFFFNCAFDRAPVDGTDCLFAEDLSTSFMNSSRGDYRPIKGGLLVDAGSNEIVKVATDFAGAARVNGAAVDIGAWEFDHSAFAVTLRASLVQGIAPQQVVLTAESSGVPDGDEVVYDWSINGGAVFSTTENFIETNLTAGAHDVTVSLRDVTSGKTATDVREDMILLYGPVIRVASGNKNAVFPYDTPETALGTLAAAVDAAVSGAVVELEPGDGKPGDYTISTMVEVTKPITIRSSTGRPEDVRLNAGGGNAIIKLMNPDALLEAVTVDCKQKGCASTGAGVHVTDGTVRNCVIRNHKVSALSVGSAAYAKGTHARFVNCTITNNTCGSTNPGYGPYCAGLQLDGGARAEGCVVAFNKTTGGAGMVAGAYLVNGKLVNCLVYGNTSVATGGVRVNAGGAYNSVIFDNVSSAAATSEGKTYDNITPGTDAMFFNCAFDRAPVAGTACQYESDAKAFFVDLAHGDYTPVKGGKLVDAGDNAEVEEERDMAGEVRIQNETVDIGPYEYNPNAFGVTLRTSATAAFAPLNVTITAEPSGVGEEDELEYTWSVNGGPSFVTASNELTTNLLVCGSYAVAVTLHNRTTGKSVSDVREDLVRVCPRVMKVVKDNPCAAFPYDTDANAAPNLLTALDAAIERSVIELAPDTYRVNSTIELDKGVTIRGATGNPADVVLKHQKTGNVSLARMFHVWNAKARIESLTIDRNKDAGSSGHGTGVYLDSAGGTVSNCVFRNHSVSDYQAGAIVYATGSQSLITHCIVTNCTGGATNPSYGNNSTAIEVVNSARCENSLSAFNTTGSVSTPGIYVSGGKVINCTVLCNETTSGAAGVKVNTSGKVINCAIVSNVATSVSACRNIVSGTDAFFTNCAFDGTPVTGEECVFAADATTYFADFASGDYRPVLGGGLAGAGARLTGYAATDLGGAKRKVGRYVDIGAYECQQTYGLFLQIR